MYVICRFFLLFFAGYLLVICLVCDQNLGTCGFDTSAVVSIFRLILFNCVCFNPRYVQTFLTFLLLALSSPSILLLFSLCSNTTKYIISRQSCFHFNVRFTFTVLQQRMIRIQRFQCVLHIYICALPNLKYIQTRYLTHHKIICSWEW